MMKLWHHRVRRKKNTGENNSEVDIFRGWLLDQKYFGHLTICIYGGSCNI